MGSGYYSFKYDSTENTLRMQDGTGQGVTLGIRGLTRNVVEISIGQTIGESATNAVLNVLSGSYHIYIPLDSVYNFPIGTTIHICTPGGNTVSGDLSSVVINGVSGGSYTLPSGISTLIKVSADNWYVS
jgi:hypothetical protein